MKKIGVGVMLMFFVILIAGILPAALWYASPWRAWSTGDHLKKIQANKKVAPAFVLNVKKVPVKYFGTLGQSGGLNMPVATPNMALSSVAPMRGQALGLGGGGMADAKMVSGVMPPFDFKNYKFEYKGELVLPTSSADILRRLKTINTSVDANNLLTGLNFGPADLSTFNGMLMQSASFIQKGEYGYNINISFDDGSVMIGQNWETWPAGKCGNDQACYDAQRVKLEEIPADAEAIAIADTFVKEHGINTSMFDVPEVNNSWRLSYEMSTDKANYYLPEMVDVIYPLKINGQNVYEEYNGQKQGLTISVHIKTKRVSSAYGLTTQEYESSVYSPETDVKKILAYAEKGGNNSYQAEGAKTVTLELGEPVQGYIKYFNYSNLSSLKNLNEELLVPALIFPIKNMPKDDPNFYRTSVIVPLIKEVLDEKLNSGGGGVPTPYLMKGAVEPAVSSTVANDVKKK